ncbi:hypothetical protein CRG98_020119 [Punica granatum]|uniref:Uncharacterized protein n=1 Tax=Punica granatum TaxID=22663 RepID=A0A2I0JT59_PUNGR|nr:hypothetical protein CRG98_020119 [Punica granatum]
MRGGPYGLTNNLQDQMAAPPSNLRQRLRWRWNRITGVRNLEKLPRRRPRRVTSTPKEKLRANNGRWGLSSVRRELSSCPCLPLRPESRSSSQFDACKESTDGRRRFRTVSDRVLSVQPFASRTGLDRSSVRLVIDRSQKVRHDAASAPTSGVRSPTPSKAATAGNCEGGGSVGR